MVLDKVGLRFPEREIRAQMITGHLPPQWTRTEERRTDDAGCCSTVLVLVFGERLMRVKAAGLRVVDVETNPGRILHGGRGMLIKDQGELTHAYRRMFEILDQVSWSRLPAEIVEFTYLEVGWNFKIPFEQLEPKIAVCRHRWVRKNPIHQSGTMWKAQGVLFAMKLYNKAKLLAQTHEIAPADMAGNPVAGTRLEFVLKKRKLDEVWKQLQLPDLPSFEDLQRLMWLCLSEVYGPDCTVSDSNVDRFALVIAQLIQQGVSLDERSPIEFVCQGMQRKRASRLKKRVQAVLLKRSGWSPHLLLGGGTSWPEPFELF